jgi:acetyl-CoA C-acetyltransferase
VSPDPRTPVIIGTGTIVNRTNEGAPVRGPVDLLVEAARVAAADATARVGADAVLDAITDARSTWVGTGNLADPAGLTARALGLRDVTSELWMGGGESSGTILADVATRTAAGELDVTLLLSGEAWYSKVAAERGFGPPLPDEGDGIGAAPDVSVGEVIDFMDPAEIAIGIDQPISMYPLLETAIRAHSGRTLDEHMVWLGEFYERFSAVAADNPTAWDRIAHSATEIGTPSRTNRWVGLPYTKLMVSDERVDQASAAILCSFATAEALGVPAEKMVFPWITVEGNAPKMSRRTDLHSSPLAVNVGATLWSMTGLGPDDIAHVDLYSCFPSAVQQQAGGYGLGLDRQLTLTGGMRFAGGPWNGYPYHALTKMTEVLRADPGSIGLWSANGGAVSKLAATILSTAPPPSAFVATRAPVEGDALATRRPVSAEPGTRTSGTIETYTVMHDSKGVPRTGFVAITPDERSRMWGRIDEPGSLADMVATEVLGRTVHIDEAGQASID